MMERLRKSTIKSVRRIIVFVHKHATGSDAARSTEGVATPRRVFSVCISASNLSVATLM